MKSLTQRTTDGCLEAKAVVRALSGWVDFHQVSLGKDDPVLPNGRRGD